MTVHVPRPDAELDGCVPVIPLPYPVHFVCTRPERWPEYVGSDATSPVEIDDAVRRVVDSEDMRVVQTYVQLMAVGLDVTIGPVPKPDAINVVSAIDMSIRHWDPHCFQVAAQSDWIRPRIANMVIGINATVAAEAGDLFVPMWPQVGLVPRDPSRPDRIGTISFKGVPMNLAPAFCSDDFRRAVTSLGVEFRIETFDRVTRQSRWHDYRDVDAVLAVRPLGPEESRLKPSGKLVNAWIAGAIPILGPEVAYQELRRSPLDFIEIRTPDEALAAIELLNGNADLFRSMVQHGRQRAAEFTTARSVLAWRDMLAGPVTREYVRWSNTSQAERAARFAAALARQKIEEAMYGRRQMSRVR